MQSLDLQTLIESAHRAGRQAWPGVRLSEMDFAAWVDAAGLEASQLSVHGSDLFLAAACCNSDRSALAELEQKLIVRVPDYLARFKLTAVLVDEVKQQVRLKMLTGDRPRIRDYRGRGPLGAWLRMCTIRTALNLPEVRSTSSDIAGGFRDTLTVENSDVHKLLDQERHQASLRRALEEALMALPPRDKTLLRMHLLDNLTIDELGLVFQVHRATAARWLVAIRAKVRRAFERKLQLDLGGGSTVHSLVRLLSDEIRVSVSRVLACGPQPP